MTVISIGEKGTKYSNASVFPLLLRMSMGDVLADRLPYSIMNKIMYSCVIASANKSANWFRVA